MPLKRQEMACVSGTRPMHRHVLERARAMRWRDGSPRRPSAWPGTAADLAKAADAVTQIGGSLKAIKDGARRAELMVTLPGPNRVSADLTK